MCLPRIVFCLELELVIRRVHGVGFPMFTMSVNVLGLRASCIVRGDADLTCQSCGRFAYIRLVGLVSSVTFVYGVEQHNRR